MVVKKMFIPFLIAIMMVGLFSVSCDGSAAGLPTKLVFTSVSVPGDAHTRAMQVFKLELERLSKGTMEVEVYHSAQLFTQTGELDACIKGTIDMAYYSAGWVAKHVPYTSMFGSVYTFSGYEHMRKVWDSEIGEKVFSDVAKAIGVRPLGACYLGTRQLNLVESVGPVKHPDDMKGVKLRTPNSPAWIALGKALGGNPTPMSFSEVYLGLKTGVIEGQDNPLPTDKNAKFYEVTKYIVLTDHLADSVWPSMNEKKWQSLSAEQQGWVKQAIDAGEEACDKQNLDNEASILGFFENEGMIIIKDPDKKAFQEYAKNSYLTESKDISKDWDMALYDKIQAMR
jgi:tripartite ATP-independent transporter DctP family solute receptor